MSRNVIANKSRAPRSNRNAPRANPTRNLRLLDDTQKAQVRNMIKSSVNLRVETKKFNAFVTPQSILDGGLVVPLSGILEGTAWNQRTGNSVTFKEWSFRYTFTAGDNTNSLRLVLFQWMDDSIPSASQIWDDVATATTSPYAHDYEGQELRVLYDSGAVNLNTAGMFQYSQNVIIRRITDPVLHFDSDNNTGWNRLYLAAISDSAVTPSPTIQYGSSLSYLDG